MIVPQLGCFEDLRNTMKHITTFILIATAIVAKAQVAQIVSPGGGKHSVPTISLEFTIGETAIATWSQPSVKTLEGIQAANINLGVVTGLMFEKAFAFYPNPTEKLLNVDGDFTNGHTFRVTDISGKDYELATEVTTHRAVIDVSSLPSSMYVLTIRDTNGMLYRMKFIKAL